MIGCALAMTGCSTDSRGAGPAESPDASLDAAPTVDAAQEATADTSIDAAEEADAAEETDAPELLDGQADAPEAAQSCTGVVCNGECLSATNCSGCAGAQLLCGATGKCVADCASCVDSTTDAGLTVACFACDSNRSNPVGTCQPPDPSHYCLSGSYLGSYVEGTNGFHCPCGDGGASDCPGDDQVCAPTPSGTHTCVTCGENFLSDLTGNSCKNGKTCDPTGFTCR
jgi:hypothetical protein